MNSKQLAVKIFFNSVLCFLLFVSCDNIFDPPKKNHPPVKSGYGRISISFAAGEAAAKTVFPSTVFDQYTYTFTKVDKQSGVVKTPDEDGFFTLEIGNYTVAVLAYTGDAEPYTLAASGVSSEFSVGSGDNDPVVVSLSRLAAGGQGEFSYTISYPVGATAKITLQKWPDLDEVTLSPAYLNEGNGITETLKLEAGPYLLTILVSKTGLHAGIGEAVYIYSSLVTEYTKHYVNNDFVSKFPGAAVSAPTLNAATQNSITINPVDPPNNGQALEYGINTSNTAPSAWQTGLTFTNLSGGVYYIFARSAGNGDYIAGAASVSQPVIIVTATDHWNMVLSTVRDGGDGIAWDPKTYTVMVFGNVAVPGSAAVSASFGSAQYIAVTLKGSGMLFLDSSGSILRLGIYQTLIINDENLTLQGRSGNNTAVIYVQHAGALELKNGVISGNTSGSQSSTVAGGGVYVDSGGTLYMTGGEISGNETYHGRGSGVYISGGTFTMSGGKISGNVAPYDAPNGGIYSTSGGGVYVGQQGIFTMSGGTVSGNEAYYGGGVYVASDGRFTMTGGIVYGSDVVSPLANTAGSEGAALYVYNGTAKYGDGSNILPHTDSHSFYTNNTIIMTSVPIAPGFVQEVLFTGQTEVINLDNLSRNVIYLVKVNTSNLVVSDANTGGAHAPFASFQNTGESSLPSGEVLPRMGHPAADAFSANPSPIVQEAPRRQRAAFVPPAAGGTRSFWVENYFDSGVFVQKQATLMASGQYGNIWVMDENLDSGTSSRKITSAQAQALADKFDLIYPLETNLLGYEYGGGPGGDGGKDGDPKIQILAYDIVDTLGDVMAAGYFWGKDFYENSPQSTLRSNFAEIFYIDADTLIYSPDYVYSTLAHEFQHMINFNQKTVKQELNSAVWYNEMLSLMVEDVIAPLIGIGPTNWNGHPIRTKMPRALNNYYLEGITEWGTSISTSYAKGFAFGAYLLRNYGGAELLHRILANNTVDIASITSALDQFSNGLTFEQALKRYGEAMIFSGSPMPEGVMTFDKTVTKTINGTAYTAYGFDVWNDFDGPKILDLSPMEMRPHSIMIHSTNAWRGSGNFSITLERPSDPNVVFYLMVK